MKTFLSATQTLFTSMLLILGLSVTLFAGEAEEFPFIGLNLSYNTITFNDLNQSIPSDDKTSFGLHLGKQTQEWRTVFAVSGNSDYQSVALEVDKILIDQLFGRPEIRPYLGATVGYLHYEDISLEGDNGYYFGGNFGFLLYATDKVDVDLSYHYYQVSGLEPLDVMRGFGLSIHYFY